MPDAEAKPQRLPMKEINYALKEIQRGDIIALNYVQQKYPNLHWTDLCYEKTGDTVLHCVSRLSLINIIDDILLKFVPKAVDCKNNDDKTALHEAAQFLQYEACQKLLDHGANVNALKKADWTPLMLACTKRTENSLRTVDLLLKYGAIVNYRYKDGWTALHLVSREGNVAILDTLVKHGLDVNLKTKNGRSALHIASLHGSIDIAKYLLNLGLFVNCRDSCGNTPLHEAVLGKNIPVCKVLIDHKADVYMKNHTDYGLLHLAACEGCVDIIQFILNDLKLNINESNKNGITALHCAARKGHNDAYQFLIKNGAEINVKDNFNRLPSDYF